MRLPQNLHPRGEHAQTDRERERERQTDKEKQREAGTQFSDEMDRELLK